MHRHRYTRFTLLVPVLLLAAAILAPGPSGSLAKASGSGAPPAADPAICDHFITEAERTRGIPSQLLSAIGVVESGRWQASGQPVRPWPWTVTAASVGRNGRFFDSRDEAIAWVRTLQAEGVRNIDVGCMQINLAAHPHAFATLEEAFSPAANVAYGADYLARQYAATRGWAQAVGNYHSSTRSFHRAYRQKVLRAWPLEQRRAAELRRQARLAALAED